MHSQYNGPKLANGIYHIICLAQYIHEGWLRSRISLSSGLGLLVRDALSHSWFPRVGKGEQMAVQHLAAGQVQTTTDVLSLNMVFEGSR